MKNYNRVSTIFIGFCYFMVLFENAITVYFPLMGNWDEAITIFSAILIVVNLFRKTVKVDRNVTGATLCFLVFLIAGAISTLLHGDLQPVVTAKLKDVLALSKLFIITMGMIVFMSYFDGKECIRMCANITKASIILILVCVVLEYSVGINMTMGVRTIRCFKFLFSHTTFAVSAYVIMLTVLLADGSKNNIFFEIGTMILIFLTMRSKGMAIIGITILLLINKKFNIIAWIKRNDSGKVVFSKVFVVLMIAVGLYFLKDKIQDYFSWGMKAARTGLYIGGFILAGKYLPFGSGFGTFATFLSGKYYSNVYYDLNLQNVDGMRPGNYPYISDVFWPCIYGQTGLIGTIAYIGMMVFLIRYFLKKADINSGVFMGATVLWMYAFIASTAEAYFTNSSVGQFAVVFALLCSVAYKDNKTLGAKKNEQC